VPVGGLAGLPSVFERERTAALAGPAAGLVLARWPEIAAAPSVLTHYDYWSGNVVWRDGALAGIVDWSGASLGPRGFDIGWCRLDLFLLDGARVADVFLDAYEDATGGALGDVSLWDAWAVARSHDGVVEWVPNYEQLGRPDLDAEALRRGHAAWTQRILSRARRG
jgi:aminoglycoside phosphotransferase (APT) family kinase protein